MADKTIAANVLQTANALQNLASLYMFVSQLSQHPQGVPLKVELNSNSSIFINSTMLLPQLQAEFQRVGEELEANNVDLEAFMEQLAEAWEKHNQPR